MPIEHLSYVFCMSLLHSFWQAGLLLLIYAFCKRTIFSTSSPGAKKSFLLFLLFAQFVLFSVGFITAWLAPQSYFEKSSFEFLNEPIFSNAGNNAIYYWLFVCYFLVLGAKVFSVSYQWIHFRQKLKHGLIKPSIDLRLFTLIESRHLGIKRNVKIWMSNNIHSPITFGFFKPVILFPVALINKLSLQQAETLVLHELTHIKVNDYILNWFLIFTEYIFFFNPFIHSICKEIRLVREMHCDMNVISFKYPGVLYAETLLLAEHFKRQVRNFQLPAVNKRPQLLQRIRFFTNSNNQFNNRSAIILPFIGTFLLLIYCCITMPSLNNTISSSAQVTQVQMMNTPATPEIQAADFIKSVINTKGLEELANKLNAAVLKQEPMIRKKLKQIEPVLKRIERNAAKISNQVEENYFMPANVQENDATRQVIVNEEYSGSVNESVKVYTLEFIHGEWILRPEWKISKKEFPDTSIKLSAENSLKTHLPAQ